MGKTMKVELYVWQDANGTVHVANGKHTFTTTISGKTAHERYHANLWQYLVAVLAIEGNAVVE